MFEQALLENINLILAAIALFLIVPLFLGMFIKAGQGDEE